MKKNLLFMFVLFVVFVSTVGQVNAGIPPYKPLTNLPFWNTDAQGNVTNPGNIVSTIYVASIGIGSILAVVMITFSGIQYMISEAISTKTDAKKRVWASLGGLLLLLSSYLILKTINPKLINGSLSIDPPKLEKVDSQGSGGLITPPKP